MPDLDNHMDDLFRKAADNYRPAEGESDWDKIAPLINIKGHGVLQQNTKRKIIIRGMAMILVLFLAATGFIIDNLINKGNNNNISVVNSVQEVKSQNTKIKYFSPENDVQRNAVIISSIANQPPSFKTTAADIANTTVTEKRTELISKVSSLAVNTSMLTAGEQEFTRVKSDSKNATGDNGIQTLSHQPGDALISMQVTKLVNDSNLLVETKKKVPEINSPVENTSKKKVNQSSGQKGFYFGFIAGVERSGVRKLQSYPGYDAGIIIGYQLNRKLAMETGVLFGKKFYTAEGKYFNPGKLDASMPAGMQILSLNGNCSVIQFPLKFNYNIVNNGKVNLFLATGISSYLLFDESNRYKTLLNGDINNMTGSYKNTTLYPMATADVSVGLEMKLPEGNRLRLEPYLQLPLKGIGVGAMKVTSTGVRASFILFSNR